MQLKCTSWLQVYAPTIPGYGRSEKPAIPYSQVVWVQFLRDFVVDVVRCPVVVAGNSIGGYISATLAADYPSLVQGPPSGLGLGILGPAVWGRDWGEGPGSAGAGVGMSGFGVSVCIFVGSKMSLKTESIVWLSGGQCFSQNSAFLSFPGGNAVLAEHAMHQGWIAVTTDFCVTNMAMSCH